jgi:hypothetical protein
MLGDSYHLICEDQRSKAMRRSLFQIASAIIIFAAGTIVGTLWQLHRSSSQKPPLATEKYDGKEWPLTKDIVSRSLQTHVFRTDKLRKNSEDEIVWRWLKSSIAEYPQNWVKLEVSERESYGVVIYPPKILDPTALAYYNKDLSEKRMPLLQEGKRYIPVQINQGNIICPDWSGLIDPDETELVYFAGHSG